MSKFNWSNPPYKIKKDGTQSKLHDRSVFRTPGNEVELAYGTFTVLKAEKVNKIWYVTLKDVNETFKIKQQQMSNKKLPKTRVIINDMQPVIAGLLPAPRELIDQIVDIVKPIGQTLTYDLLIYRNGDSLQSKLNAIALILQLDCNDGNLCRKIYKQLRFHYHPDRNNGTTTDIYRHIQQIFEQWVKNK